MKESKREKARESEKMRESPPPGGGPVWPCPKPSRERKEENE